MAASLTLPKIILLGDLAVHTMVVRNFGKPDEHHPVHPFEGMRRQATDPILPKMIQTALEDKLILKDADPIWPSYSRWKRPVPELISVLATFPESSRSSKDARDKTRVRASYFLAPPKAAPATSGRKAARDGMPWQLPEDQLLEELNGRVPDDGTKHLLVVYDHGSHSWASPPGVDKKKFAHLAHRAKGGIVIGINSDLEKLDWLEAFMPADEDVRTRTVIQVTADGLRKAGVNITKYGALEETVRDIFKSLDSRSEPLATLAALSGHLVILFSETGGLYIPTRGAAKASLHFCPNFDRMAQLDAKTYGSMPGRFSIFLVALVKQFYNAAKNDEELDLPSAVRLGTVAYNQLFKSGLGANPIDPFKAFEDALSVGDKLKDATVDALKRELLVSSLEFERRDEETWRRTHSLLCRTGETFQACLRGIVCRGLNAELINEDPPADAKRNKAWFPRSYISVPYAGLGKLTLLDQDEIARHYSLAKVIRKYIESPADWKTPLSIAVFGRPGSGKSYGVKQVLESVDPGRKGEPLNFNLAQFSSVDQLTEAFHQIQDRALASDEVPLAIFDEFDSHFVTPFGWLKYFLAPMQDGVFRGKSGDYKVGRAIFLFAGGTSDTYEKFRKPLELLGPPFSALAAPEQRRQAGRLRRFEVAPAGQQADKVITENDVRAFKLADFNSRLRGTLDITEINDPRDDADPTRKPSPMTQLRRAAILRSLLEQHARPIFVFHPSGMKQALIRNEIIDAFLTLPQYSNGVRSMEAIIQMSRWIDDEFVPASLPAGGLLEVHTCGQLFLRRQQ